MESSGNLEKRLDKLNGKSLIYRRKQYLVKSAQYRLGRFAIKTDSNWFAFEKQNFIDFLNEIEVLEDDDETGQSKVVLPSYSFVEKKYKSNKLKIQLMDAKEKLVVTTSSNNVAQINDALMEKFNKLSANPTEEDYKQADAMCKIVGTMVSTMQVQINLVKLNNGR